MGYLSPFSRKKSIKLSLKIELGNFPLFRISIFQIGFLGSEIYEWEVSVAPEEISTAEIWLAMAAAIVIIISLVIVVAVKIIHHRSKSSKFYSKILLNFSEKSLTKIRWLEKLRISRLSNECCAYGR